MRMIVSLKYAVMALAVIAGGLAVAPVFETDHHRGPAAVIDADTLQINDTAIVCMGSMQWKPARCVANRMERHGLAVSRR